MFKLDYANGIKRTELDEWNQMELYSAIFDKVQNCDLLDACMRLYKRLCPLLGLGLSVCWSICPHVTMNVIFSLICEWIGRAQHVSMASRIAVVVVHK
jgi:hypothetical protein